MATDQAGGLKRVGENLYVNDHGSHFAWFSMRGKQIKRSPRIEDKALAWRRLADLREKEMILTSYPVGAMVGHKWDVVRNVPRLITLCKDPDENANAEPAAPRKPFLASKHTATLQPTELLC